AGGPRALHRAARGSAGDRRRAGALGRARPRRRAPPRPARGGLAEAAGRSGRAMIGVVFRKELLEVRRSPVLILSMASLPATVVAVPLALLAWVLHAAPEQALVFVEDVYGIRLPQ